MSLCQTLGLFAVDAPPAFQGQPKCQPLGLPYSASGFSVGDLQVLSLYPSYCLPSFFSHSTSVSFGCFGNSRALE